MGYFEEETKQRREFALKHPTQYIIFWMVFLLLIFGSKNIDGLNCHFKVKGEMPREVAMEMWS